ncbi:IS630 family transposase [Candidatus Rhabdochlamydia oedothoracis]|uniref:IS630 family transposase n=1 Tax=Candidatus Rhabdochlamydia oedothoracis TaxID=2720720 RepID=UPI001FD8E11B|nr:IS630 family transposase [Candidatus Rhabdochlamydia oedothoracis]
MAFYKERNAEARAEYLKKIEAISPEKRVYLDQSGISQYVHRQYARSARGKQIFGGISGKRFGRRSVISALQGKKLLAPMCFEGTCHTDLFNVWLKQELIPNLTHGQVLILDNASFHQSKTTRTLIEESGYEMLFLPPYSPDLNPIEKYWANMKTKIRELLPTVANLSEALDQAVLSMSI